MFFRCVNHFRILVVIFVALPLTSNADEDSQVGKKQNRDASHTENRLRFDNVPNLPNDIGVAGPIVGIHDDLLIVAGGANFAKSDDPKLWEVPKKYLDGIWVLSKTGDGDDVRFQWNQNNVGKLSQPVGYSAVVSTPFGVLCLGGNDADGSKHRAFLLQATIDKGTLKASISENDLGVPDLPMACTASGAALVGDYIYLVAGQVRKVDGSNHASRVVWRLKLSELENGLNRDVNQSTQLWEQIASWPNDGPRRMFPLVVAQHDGFGDRLYVLGGRHFVDGSDTADLANLKFCGDCWSFDPSKYEPEKFDNTTQEYSGDMAWKRLADSPVALTAGTALPVGPAHVIVLSYASGDILKKMLDSGVPDSQFSHPGFPKQAYSYHTVTNTWTPFGEIPINQVTTPAVKWGEDLFLVSGEIKPRVRTNKVWRIRVNETSATFGVINMTVVVVYLIAMVGVGIYFTLRNKTTDDYFRGGKSIPWWAAGCSIFATMLSSITYMAVPAKAFAQNWVYAIGNGLILCVAPIAIFVALPFFRRIDATSAYEYLEKRFNRTARWIGSASFSVFHVFRMGVVLALAAMALASVTPLSPAQCVLVMGALSIIYCTLGGIEAVVWTDTIQTFVLMGGAVLCLIFAFIGSGEGSLVAAVTAGKFELINIDFSTMSFTTMAIWVVVLGGVGQNIASYTADQAVVQRYMTTTDEKAAARSIWLNGFMAIFATTIFFGLGTAFWMFYRTHPAQLDPTIASDRIMPLFISQQLPIGLAGLVVAGIFAAAQSTVSTSMNSGATTIVTDFLKPMKLFGSDAGYLWAARVITLLMGILGTFVGLWFIDPSIKSQFDLYIGILGMFLGVLAGLFALGAMTRRANPTGSLIGAFVAIGIMSIVVLAAKDISVIGYRFRAIFEAVGSDAYKVSGYLYAFIGIAICFVVGFVTSIVVGANRKSLEGLTVWDQVKNE